jgi:succinyl-CoA synthetase beta subunit
MDVILMNPKVRGILVNIFGGITRCDEVARGLITARDNVGLELPLVVRLSGTNEEEGRQILEQNGIQPGANGWEAAQKIVELSGVSSSPRSGEVARSAGGAR